MRYGSLVIAGALAIGCQARAARPTAPQADTRTATREHRVVVAIVVDQLAGWVAKERLPLLPSDGGFARLRREGRYVTDMRYAHAVTDTAPGHAALYTGLPPAENGIVANETLDDHGARASFLSDTKTHRVARGVVDGASSSLARLDGLPSARREPIQTLSDILRARSKGAVIISLSLKDRGALFGGGRHPTASVWLDTTLGRFVTSSALSEKLPEWAEKFGDEAAVAAAMTGSWAPMDPAWVGAHAPISGAEGEGDLKGLGVGAAHDLRKIERRSLGSAFRATPMADTLLLDMARAALDGEGAKAGAPHETFLTISLSANDYIGHVFGPNSWEAWDELFRLDRELARFLDALDLRFGKAGYSVLLTADHGTTSMVEATRPPSARPWCTADAGTGDPWERACGPVVRVMPEEMTTTINKALESVVPEGAVTAVLDPYIYLSNAARALGPDAEIRLPQVLYRTLKSMPGVREVYRVPAESGRAAEAGARSGPGLPKSIGVCTDEMDESEQALVCRSVSPEGPGDFYVVTETGSYFDPNVVVGKGASHGSPRLYDRSVPLLIRRADGARAGEVDNAPQSYRVFAATAAELLQIPWHK